MIFNYNSWESVKALQFCCGRLDFYHVYVKRKLTFLRALYELDNLVVRACFSVFEWSQECRELSNAFNCIIGVFSVVELRSVFSVKLVCWFMEILNLYF